MWENVDDMKTYSKNLAFPLKVDCHDEDVLTLHKGLSDSEIADELMDLVDKLIVDATNEETVAAFVYCKDAWAQLAKQIPLDDMSTAPINELMQMARAANTFLMAMANQLQKNNLKVAADNALRKY